MEQKKENEWTKYICELLRKELDTNKYEITCLERVPYRANIVGFDDNGKEKIETSKYNSKDIIDLSITTKYSVPTVKDLKDYYFDNYQVKVIYSDNKEEMFEGKNILSGTVLDFD